MKVIKFISHLHVLVNISQPMHKLDVRISEIKPDTKPPENPLMHLTKLDPLYFHTIDSLNRNYLDTLNLSRLEKRSIQNNQSKYHQVSLFDSTSTRLLAFVPDIKPPHVIPFRISFDQRFKPDTHVGFISCLKEHYLKSMTRLKRLTLVKTEITLTYNIQFSFFHATSVPFIRILILIITY